MYGWKSNLMTGKLKKIKIKFIRITNKIKTITFLSEMSLMMNLILNQSKKSKKTNKINYDTFILLITSYHLFDYFKIPVQIKIV